MEEFVFKGDWEFELKLPKLSSLDNERFYQFGDLKELKIQGLLPIQIDDVEDLNPDPLPEQIEAIRYLQNEEEEIYTNIFNIFKNELYPRFAEDGWEIEDKNWFPDLHEESDLFKILSINKIIIESESLNGIAYIKLQGEFSGDEEHGFSMIIHKKRLIDFGGETSLWIENILKDKGEDTSNFIENYINRKKPTSADLYLPQNVYNKLKPWQIRHNNDLIRQWIQEGNNEKIINSIKSSLLKKEITDYNENDILEKVRWFNKSEHKNKLTLC